MPDFETIYNNAVTAGREAATKMVPTPMTVVGGGQRFYVPDGACGFAWVIVKPGTSKFARWLKANKHARPDSYYGGVSIWISEHSQSVDRKTAHANAMADVLSTAFPELKITPMSRLD